MSNLNGIKAELCKKSFYIFFKEFWSISVPAEFEDNWHIRYICDELQQIGETLIEGKVKLHDLIINVPPGSTKSTIASVMFPAWLWTKQQSLKVLTGSHSSTVSLMMSVKSRDIIRSEKYKLYFPEVKLKDDEDTKSFYATTELGERRATTVGKEITGHHADIIIIDDAVPASPSENQLDRAKTWMTEKLQTRKSDKRKTPTILIMQRVSDKDPTAILLKTSDNVKHICLPAEVSENVKPDSLKDNYINGYLDPNRLGESVLREMQVALGSYGYSSQFQQTPSPKGGGIIKDEWIKVKSMDEVPLKELLKIPPNFYVDTAYTENRDNDPSAIIVAKEYENQLYIMNGEQFWMEFPSLVKKIIEKVNQQGYTSKSKIYVEGKASGKSLIQQLKKDTKLNVIEDKTLTKLKGGKEQRLESISPIVESGRVIFIDGSWNDELKTQITSMKPARYDMRDALIMSVQNEILNKRKGSGTYAYKRS